MALSDEIQDVITRHQVYLLRYSAGREKEAAQYIDEITRRITDELMNDELTDMDIQRLNRFMDEIVEFQQNLMGQLEEKILDDVDDLANQETDWATAMLSNFLGELDTPSRIETQLAVFAGILPVAGLTIRSLVSRFRQKKIAQTVQSIRDGITLRENNQQIIGRMQTINPLHKKQAGVLIKTITNYTSVQARDVAMRLNPNFFDGYEWVSVLDSRTSLICASRDGTVYPFTNDPVLSPKPPAHFSCRSTITPKLKPQFESRQNKQPRRTAEGAKGKTKVNAQTNYQSWLTRQPAAFQDEVLGKTRGLLFRRGKLPISKFVDESGKTLTLNELRKVEPEVFNRVKL
jgi:SPP1 gp7 family putative phage head morphogenesis protein